MFGIADAYLGLKVGITVSAWAIPAAVISMAVLRGVLKRNGILENNLVQDLASVGESLAGGAVFTIPALFILPDHLRKEGQIAFTGSHSAFLRRHAGRPDGDPVHDPQCAASSCVKEHGRLKYPEGTACAKVLIAGDKGGDAAKTVFSGILDLRRLSLLHGWSGAVQRQNLVAAPGHRLGALASTCSPSLLAVGFILGIRTCAIMMAGAGLGWFCANPADPLLWLGADPPGCAGAQGSLRHVAEGAARVLPGQPIHWRRSGGLRRVGEPGEVDSDHRQVDRRRGQRSGRI